MTEENLQYQQFSLLDDHSLIEIYGIASKVLHERNLLTAARTSLKTILNEKKARSTVKDYKTPSAYSDRGKVKRIASHSILIDFLNEDWGFLFNGEYDQERKYYVYYHADPKKGKCRFKKGDQSHTFMGRPFYIGKGTGDRYRCKKRSRSHISIINTILDSGHKEDDIFFIFKDNLTEKEALELEAKLITFFGCSGELDTKKCHFHGTKGGWLINADPAVRPADVSNMMKVKGWTL